ncbi:MAG: helix-turn-helix transcriptional regulator [Polaromonas sp.]|jgi:predicted DNA-binding transcriptional regulator AlpA
MSAKNMATPELLLAGFRAIQADFAQLCRVQGVRLTRQQVCDRLDIHRNTLNSYITDKGFPKPMRDGRWLLADVVEWEAER